MRPLARSPVEGLRDAAPGAALALAVGALFWLPSASAARGYFPAPLDDVYIHFDFARSLAEGHPFEWIPGNGYSSGETSPLYALLLAVGWVIGFRGKLLGAWAAVVAVASLASFLSSVRKLARPCPSWLGWGAAVLTLSVGVVDWSLFSGMEVAAFAGALGRALLALQRSRGSLDARGGLTREAAQWRLGLWGIVLTLLRPEAIVLVGVFAVMAARGAGPRSVVAALLRASSPAALATAALLGANFLATGTAASAGAQLKLLSSNPYLSSTDRARVYVENLVTFAVKGVRIELSGVTGLAACVAVLALAPLLSRSRRAIAAACLLGALAWTLLASWNANSPFHNFRYYAPALLLVLVSAGTGAATLWRALGRRAGPVVSLALLGAAIAAGALRLPAQVTHFTRAVRNIRDQQVEIGRRLAAGPRRPARLLVNDAGAIPFVSRLPAIDAMGLGGYHAMPFARAAVQGEGATVELLERLAPSERPTHLVVHPNWFGAMAGRFGVEIDRVTLTDNLICAGASKVVYEADWSPLAGREIVRAGTIDEVDVADVISEAEHGYRAPLPDGRTTFEVMLDGARARRFDAGRHIPEGRSERFVIRGGAGRSRIVVRTDPGARGIELSLHGQTVAMELGPPEEGAWREAWATVETGGGAEEITLTAAAGPYRDYHVWVEGPDR